MNCVTLREVRVQSANKIVVIPTHPALARRIIIGNQKQCSLRKLGKIHTNIVPLFHNKIKRPSRAS